MQAYTYLLEEDSRRIKAAIVSKGLNIKMLAEKAGSTRATLSNKINGKTEFTRSEMEAIAKILNTSPQTLFFGPELRFA